MTAQPIAIESTNVGPHVPDKMRGAIMRALEKDPAQRWLTVREFSDAFAGSGAAAPAVRACRRLTRPRPIR